MNIKLLYILIFICSYINLFSSEDSGKIIGVWQKKICYGPLSTNVDVYRFYQDGSFEFDFNGFLMNRKVIKITGKYKLIEDSLYTLICQRYEYISTYIQRGSSELAEWITDSDSVRVVEQEGGKWDIIGVRFEKAKNQDIDCDYDSKMIIDNSWIYYKVSPDPYIK